MIATHLNPEWLEESAYIDFLNRGFPGQWDRASFEFYMRRSFLGKSTDIGVRAHGSRILAGVSYCYRQICVDQGRPIDVCVMSAGTTLPSERGRGHYRELLHTGLDLCRSNACSAILGFVTRENASGRGLQRLGAYSIPSFYIVSDVRKSSFRPALPVPSRQIRRVTQRSKNDIACSGQVRFHYADRREWLQQFVHRANPVRAVQLSHDSHALVETVAGTDRVQWLGCPADKVLASVSRLAAASHAAKRNFFMFTLDPLLANAASRLGLKIRPGLLMLLPIDRSAEDWRRIAGADWRLHSGDRM